MRTDLELLVSWAQAADTESPWGGAGCYTHRVSFANDLHPEAERARKEEPGNDLPSFPIGSPVEGQWGN